MCLRFIFQITNRSEIFTRNIVMIPICFENILNLKDIWIFGKKCVSCVVFFSWSRDSIVQYYLSLFLTIHPWHRGKNARKFELNRVIENAFIIFVSKTFPHITLSSFQFAYLLPCVCRLLHLFRLFSLYSMPAVRPLSFSLAAGTNRNFSGRWRACKAQQVELRAVSQKIFRN